MRVSWSIHVVGANTVMMTVVRISLRLEQERIQGTSTSVVVFSSRGGIATHVRDHVLDLVHSKRESGRANTEVSGPKRSRQPDARGRLLVRM
jgi:hypothetical protein